MAVTNNFVTNTLNHANFQRTIRDDVQMAALLKVLADEALKQAAGNYYPKPSFYAAAAALNSYLFKADINSLKTTLDQVPPPAAYASPATRTTGFFNATPAPVASLAPLRKKPRLRWIKPAYDSSVIDAVKYDRATATLWIRMNSGNIYQYNNVPSLVYTGLRYAASPGSYYNASIKGVYTVKN